MKIMIAEDDFTSRKVLAAILKKRGHEVVETSNGLDAWEEMQKPEAPRLVILDWNMPGMDGLEVCRKIRERGDALDPPYVILLTARGDKDGVVKGLDAGANDYITKPYDNDELQARLGVGQRMLKLQDDLNSAKMSLAYEAMHDSLTGLYNRRAILEALEREIARIARENNTLRIGLIDIDHFKHVNDTYGHQVGDDALCTLTNIIQENIRKYDLVGRYGGEEFLLITPCLGDSVVGDVYERLRARIAGSALKTRAGEISITVSIGVAELKYGDEKDIDAILKVSDVALYAAKAKGRNCIVYA